MREHLPVGSLVTKLDDTPLTSVDDAVKDQDVWDMYLTDTYRDMDIKGWCVNTTWWMGE